MQRTCIGHHQDWCIGLHGGSAAPAQRRSKSRGWQDQFFFMESQMLPGDCENLNFYCANAPTSLFYHVRNHLTLLSALHGLTLALHHLWISSPSAHMRGVAQLLQDGLSKSCTPHPAAACPCMQTLVMAIQTHEGGRVTLFGDELRIHSPDGSVEQKKIETLEDFKQMLTLFGIPADEL